LPYPAIGKLVGIFYGSLRSIAALSVCLISQACERRYYVVETLTPNAERVKARKLFAQGGIHIKKQIV
jgi:hypothetical protein